MQSDRSTNNINTGLVAPLPGTPAIGVCSHRRVLNRVGLGSREFLPVGLFVWAGTARAGETRLVVHRAVRFPGASLAWLTRATALRRDNGRG